MLPAHHEGGSTFKTVGDEVTACATPVFTVKQTSANKMAATVLCDKFVNSRKWRYGIIQVLVER